MLLHIIVPACLCHIEAVINYIDFFFGPTHVTVYVSVFYTRTIGCMREWIVQIIPMITVQDEASRAWEMLTSRGSRQVSADDFAWAVKGEIEDEGCVMISASQPTQPIGFPLIRPS